MTFWLFFISKKQSIKQVPVKKVDISFKNVNGNYIATGNKNEFIVKKDDRFEFLVKDGEIIACKDNSRHSQFIYYKEA
ncbi:hypothetical protein [Ornithinibacillus salinisoli]|uniref:hypothetical protein n=1 Tax=Ornithinibacillus salinisoli TaxID=1848459 RepID=UPI00366FABB6